MKLLYDVVHEIFFASSKQNLNLHTEYLIS